MLLPLIAIEPIESDVRPVFSDTHWPDTVITIPHSTVIEIIFLMMFLRRNSATVSIGILISFLKLFLLFSFLLMRKNKDMFAGNGISSPTRRSGGCPNQTNLHTRCRQLIELNG